jgi:SAM-dependent methyltransferase
MAIPESVVSLLIEEHMRRPFQGRLLQLGRQDTYVSLAGLERQLRRHRIVPQNAEALRGISDPDLRLTDQELFGVFGFNGIEATDASRYEEPDFTYDLNSAELPTEYQGAYDCVFDGGTMEHVFHTQNVLKNIFDLLKPGGRIIHFSPSSNSVDHGFYSFSPCFFLQYYTANHFQINCCKLLNLGTRLLPMRVTAYNCLPPIPRSILDGYLSGNIHCVFFVATKTEESVYGRIPQQGAFTSLWEAWQRPTLEVNAGLAEEAKALIKRWPGLAKAIRKYGVPLIRMQRVYETRAYLRRLAQRY